MAARAAVSLLCLLGTASAQGYNTTSSTGATATTYSDGAMPTIAGVTYDIQTDTSYNGVTINLARKSKRASDAGLSSCMSTCSQNVACVGTAYDSADSSCTYYSSIDGGSEYTAEGVDFATVESRVSGGTTSFLNGTTATPTGSLSTTATGASNLTTSAGGSYSNATTSLGATSTKGSATSKSASAGSMTGSTTSGTGASATSTPASIITFDGVEFLIEIDVTYAGILIDIDIIFAKRATYTLEDCLATCANDTSCAGTAFDSETDSCAFYSYIESDSRTADNGTTFATVISRPGTNDTTGGDASAESLICPSYNGHVITSEQGISFSIGCSEVIVGTTFDITTSARRRADTGLPQTLSNCVDVCATSDACLGTSFETATETCTYYSSVRYTVVVDGVDSASRISTGTTTTSVVTSYVPTTVPVTTTVVLGNGVTTVTAGVVTTTATALVTGVSTAPGSAAGSGSSYTTVTATVFTTTVTAAFADGSGVATSVVPVTTTTYVSAVASSAAAYNAGGATTTVYVTVDGSGSGSDSGSGAATVTVTSAVSYCPTDVTFTTVYT